MNRRKPWRFPACSVTSTSLRSACKGHPDGPLPPSLRTSPPRHPLFRHGHYTAPHVNAAPSLCQRCPRTGTWPLRPLLPSLAHGCSLSNARSRDRAPGSLPCSLPASARHRLASHKGQCVRHLHNARHRCTSPTPVFHSLGRKFF